MTDIRDSRAEKDGNELVFDASFQRRSASGSLDEENLDPPPTSMGAEISLSLPAGRRTPHLNQLSLASKEGK